MQVKVTVTDEVGEALAARAALERRSVAAMGGLLLEDALAVKSERFKSAPVSPAHGDRVEAEGPREPQRDTNPAAAASRKCPMYTPAGTICKSCGKRH